VDGNLLTADSVKREPLDTQLDRDKDVRELGVDDGEHAGRTERENEFELLPEERAIEAPRQHRAEHREYEKTFDAFHDDHRPNDGHDVAAHVGGDEERGRPHENSTRGIVEDVIGSLLPEPVVIKEFKIEEEEIHDEGSNKIVAGSRENETFEEVNGERSDGACDENENRRVRDALPLATGILRNEVYQVCIDRELDETRDQYRVEHEFAVLPVGVHVEDPHEEDRGEKHDAVVQYPAEDENDRPFRERRHVVTLALLWPPRPRCRNRRRSVYL
jgi:hypothetical protein